MEMDGKEGVSGSSPEGLCKSPALRGLCVSGELQVVECGAGMEPYVEPSEKEPPS